MEWAKLTAEPSTDCETAANPPLPPTGDTQKQLYVVGLGASAGGLDALEKFFDHMPADSGLAFVVIQHLSPDFKSLMDELLARHTDLAIHRVEDGMQIQANSIYLIPPKKEMIVSGERLLLTDKDPTQGLSLPIDTFLRSLAQDVGRRAVAVILSGTGSDGSRGIRAVHEAGGLVLVQDEATADFDGMPRSAIHTGVVDAVLSPRQIAERILQHVRSGGVDGNAVSNGQTPISDDGVSQLFGILNEAYGIDFSHYKPSTVARRVERRLQMSRLPDLCDYAARVREDADELNSLYKDLLIGVTKFFRDEEAFGRLERDVIPQLLKQVPEKEEIRVWVAGCATGEEAYSVAMLLHEALADSGRPIHAKVFSTDVHQSSLAFASAGVYSDESLSEVSPARLARYFTKHAAGYQVSQDLRKIIVFAPHNVVKDAPFTTLDLICCRNMLIYLQPHAQRKVLSLFHFGLKAAGFLFLGPSETPGELSEEFDAIDRHWKVFRKRRDVRLAPDVRMPLSTGFARLRGSSERTYPSGGVSEPHLLRAFDAILSEVMPPSVLVSSRRKLLHSVGGAGRFLSVPDGKPPEDILDFVHADLKLALSGALHRAAKEKQCVIFGGIRIRSLDEGEHLRLSVKPITVPSLGEDYFLISFEIQTNAPPQPDQAPIDLAEASRDRLRDVEEELRYTKENLQATIEELETTNEELQAANEELVASNEELQSTNEELHSVNEELYSVNAEHQRKITELTELTDDMDNLLRSTDVGTIFLDRDLCIRKFTPKISHAFQVLQQDVGRPIEVFSHNLLCDDLLSTVRRVLESEEPLERDVQDRHGNWFLLRVLPYRTRELVEGVVLTLIDISARKRTEDQLRRMSKVYMDGADPIMIEDLEGCIIDLNTEAERAYGWRRQELVGRHATALVPPECFQQFREVRERCRNAERVRNVESARQDRDGRVHPILLTLSLLTDEGGQPIGIATISKDIQAQKDAEYEAREAAKKRDEFLAMLSHELRNPLGAVLNATQVLAHQDVAPEAARMACDVVSRQARQMARLLDDLLDVARVTQGRIDIRKEVVDLSELVGDAVEAIRARLDERGHNLQTAVLDQPLWVEGDPSRLLQIQENLLANAIKYTPCGGRIALSLARDGDEAVIRVSDNGQGIPPDMLHSIFDLFFQGDRTLARGDGGMGVGLNLVRLLVDLHGGTVTAYSAGLGQGSTFEVRLPLTRKTPRKLAPVEAGPADGTRVVIVEDNGDSRNMVSELLRLDGYQLSAAADGVEGYQVILRERPDVALIDIGLPGMDGYQVARKIRSELEGHPIRLVALTGYGRSEDRKAVKEAGFDDHLVKPIAPDDLTRVLRKPR
jgi:two-component system CheB/CheR fusion protein